jgi:hypothetical protein
MRLYYLLQFFKGQFMLITQGKLLVFAIICGIRYRSVVNIIIMNIQQRDKKVQGVLRKKKGHERKVSVLELNAPP